MTIRHILAVTALTVASFAAVAASDRDRPGLAVEGILPPLSGATEWINSEALTPQALRGKVVLVNVWTYSCINSLRPMPYLRAWAEKYKDAGLVVIGVHSPEFEFEKLSSNVHDAILGHHITFPVAVDTDQAIWRALHNEYWPALYFVDAQGRIRHHRFGEGDYEQLEQVIQRLLAEAGSPAVPTGFVSPSGQGVEASAGSPPARSEETYLGYARATHFVSTDGLARDRVHVYRGGATDRTDSWTLSGDWTVEGERAVLQRANGRVAYRFHARDLHMVLGPSRPGVPVRFRVLIDGKPPMSDHGFDTDAQGRGTIDRHRLYQLVRQATSTKPRLFEIEFEDAGAQAYAFTFG